jgi:hypothetical protein
LGSVLAAAWHAHTDVTRCGFHISFVFISAVHVVTLRFGAGSSLSHKDWHLEMRAAAAHIEVEVTGTASDIKVHAAHLTKGTATV